MLFTHFVAWNKRSLQEVIINSLERKGSELCFLPQPWESPQPGGDRWRGFARGKPHPVWGEVPGVPPLHGQDVFIITRPGNPRKGTEQSRKHSHAEKCHSALQTQNWTLSKPLPWKVDRFPFLWKCPALSAPRPAPHHGHQWVSHSGNLLAEEKLTWHSS